MDKKLLYSLIAKQTRAGSKEFLFKNATCALF